MLNKAYKDLDNDLDIELDVERWLENETITDVELVDSNNLTVTGLTFDNTSLLFTTEDGVDDTEYAVILKVTTNKSKKRFIQTVAVDNDLVEYYGSIYDGNRYFQDRLRTSPWNSATDSDKRKALIEASSYIDLLSFKGDKTSSNQNLEFPRNGEDLIPDEVNFATYELAIELLAGADPEALAKNAAVLKEEFETVKVTYAPAKPLHANLGLVSNKALMYLQPFLAVKACVELKRTS